MLLLCILFITSVWFCIDYPASLEKNIETGFGVSETKYGLLYTFFAIPNCIMPLVGGIFFDKLGTRNGLMLFSFVVCIGQGLLMLGGYQMSFNTLLIGRIVFGIGCEAMIVGQSAIASAWFMNFELSFAMSVIVCFPMLGSFMQGALIPTVYERTEDFGWVFAIGFIMCLGSFLISILMAIMDSKTEKADNRLLDEYALKKKEAAGIRISGRKSSAFGGDNVSSYSEAIKEHFDWNDLTQFPKQFWYTCISCCLMQIAINNFLVIGSAVLQTRYGWTEIQAGYLFPMPYVFAAFLSPILGKIIDKYGFRNQFSIIGSFCMITAHAMQLFMPDCEEGCAISIVPLFLLGVSYCTYAVA
jgi:MFS family permease